MEKINRIQRIGYACINLSVEPKKFRTTTLSWLNRQSQKVAEQRLYEIYKNNLEYLYNIIDYNIHHNIWAYRISSSLFPMADHPNYSHYFNKWVKSNPRSLNVLRESVKKYLDNNGRLEIHPGAFCVISSCRESVRTSSISYLEFQASILNLLNIPQNYDCPITLHISNGKNGYNHVDYVKKSLSDLSFSVISRLSFENEDANYWTVSNIRKHFPNTPVIFDTLHESCNPDGRKLHIVVEDVKSSWGETKPLMHYSEGINGEKDRRHSDYIKNYPSEYLDWADVIVEAKKKNLAILNCFK